MNCFYIRSKIRTQKWKLDQAIKKAMKNRISETSINIKKMIESIQRINVEKAKNSDQSDKSKDKLEISIANSFFSSFAMFSTFAVVLISNRLLNCWTLNSEIDTHVWNDSARFQLNRLVNLRNRLRIDKTIYSIENYETIDIVVKKSSDSINIRLLNVVLISSFLINLVCLSKFIAKEIHWNIEKEHLHTNETTFCYTESMRERWNLKNNLSSSNQSNDFAAFGIKSNQSKSDWVTIDAEWHMMLEHVSTDTIANLEKEIDETKIKENAAMLSTIECETCALIKTHHLISRRIDQSKKTLYSFDRIGYDLILMQSTYNDDQWISHFICFFTHINFVWTHFRKNDALSVIKKFVKLTTTRFKQIVRFIRINNEQILRI